MLNQVKNFVSSLFYLLPAPIKRTYYYKKYPGASYANFDMAQWKRQGRPCPPPHGAKQELINEVQRQAQYDILVETGTYLGQMVTAQLPNFKRIYSVELSEALWQDAKIKFKDEPKVTLLQGDSGVVLHELVHALDKPAIFWLDGHYSEGITARGELICPIYNELKAINKSPLNHVLLIDDARLFVGKDDYPTLKDLSSFIKDNWPHSTMQVKDDSIIVRTNRHQIAS